MTAPFAQRAGIILQHYCDLDILGLVRERARALARASERGREGDRERERDGERERVRIYMYIHVNVCMRERACDDFHARSSLGWCTSVGLPVHAACMWSCLYHVMSCLEIPHTHTHTHTQQLSLTRRTHARTRTHIHTHRAVPDGQAVTNRGLVEGRDFARVRGQDGRTRRGSDQGLGAHASHDARAKLQLTAQERPSIDPLSICAAAHAHACAPPPPPPPVACSQTDLHIFTKQTPGSLAFALLCHSLARSFREEGRERGSEGGATQLAHNSHTPSSK